MTDIATHSLSISDLPLSFIHLLASSALILGFPIILSSLEVRELSYSVSLQFFLGFVRKSLLFGLGFLCHSQLPAVLIFVL
jgi:hypothetical protein